MVKQTYNLSQLAAEFELDRRTVAKRIGAIKPVGTEGRSKLYYLKDVAPFLVDFPSEDGLDFHGQRTRLTRLQADKLQREIELESAKYVSLEQADCSWTKLVLASRSRLLAMPSKMAPQMVGHKTPNKPFQLLTDAIYEALTELSTKGAKIMGEYISQADIQEILEERNQRLQDFKNELVEKFSVMFLEKPYEEVKQEWQKFVSEKLDQLEAETIKAIKKRSFPVGDWQ